MTSRICKPGMSWDEMIRHQREAGHDDERGCISLSTDTLCAECGKYSVNECETDDDGVFWTYCRPCNFWTEHGQS